jgi:proteic killer suppression protein
MCATEVVLLKKLGENKVSICHTFYRILKAANYFHSTSKKDLAISHFIHFFVNIKGKYYLCNFKLYSMDITFEKAYLQEMYQTGKTTDKKRQFQPAIIRKYIRVVDLMIDQPDTETLKKYNSLNYEKLKGDKAGLSSVRVNDRYRIEFEEKTVNNQTVATICNITELSNHYK